VHLQIGSRLPAYTTSGGKIMLAHLDDRLRANLLKGSQLRAYTSNTRTLIADLEEEFAEIRERGYALNDQEFAVGIVGAAVPVMDRGGRVVAALATHGPAPRLDLERAEALVPRLQEAARALARAWGLETAASRSSSGGNASRAGKSRAP
jgi:DNA-binding IclR family transcriptional regulator